MSTRRPRYPLLRLFSRLGARFGHAGSMVLLGAIHEADAAAGDAPDPGAAIGKANRLYRRAAAKGDTQAMWSLGVNHLASKGGETDHAQAVEWITRAAEGGHGMAAWALGKMYLAGRLVGPDVERGLALLERSAAAGFTDAGLLLAEIYRTGRHGVAVDEEAARHWLTRAGPPRARSRALPGLGGERST